LTGVKHLISNSDFCDTYNVVCKASGGANDPQIIFLIVDKKTDGFMIKPMARCMGCTGTYHERVVFDNCVVPMDNIIGEEARGLEYALHELNTSRVRIATNALGIMERCLDLSVEYAKKRVTFGKPIAQRQAVQSYLSDTAMTIYALQGMINEAARKIDNGEDVELEANLCKIFSSEAVRRATDNAMLIFGGIGYTAEYPIQRLYRDARLNWLEEATPSIPTLTAARRLVEGKRTYKAFHEEKVETSFDKALKHVSPELESRLRAL
jgi:alkylation response protein AidB-like acyl-CoA dehydrogenase